MFTWDEAKRRSNLKKHGFDFTEAELVFAGPTLSTEDMSSNYGEQRLKTLGLLRDMVVMITHTPRGEDDHIISIRKADRHETHTYYSQI